VDANCNGASEEVKAASARAKEEARQKLAALAKTFTSNTTNATSAGKVITITP
jgi:hypothetical protein